MLPGRRLIVGAAASLAVAGCASATSSVADNGDAATALRAAATKTLDVDSFHAQMTFQVPSSSGTGMVDYQAPDREHEQLGSGKDSRETISIGDTVYFTALNKPGYFWRFEGRGNGASDTLAYLRFLQQGTNVRLDGHLYRFQVPQSLDVQAEGPTSGVATLTDGGLINTLLYHFHVAGGDISVGLTYGGYNSGITVEPPPPDRVVQPPGIGCPTSMPLASSVLPKGADICEVLSPTPSP